MASTTLTGPAFDALNLLADQITAEFSEKTNGQYRVELAPSLDGHSVTFRYLPAEPAADSLLAGVLQLAEVLAPARVEARAAEREDAILAAFGKLTGIASSYAPGSGDERRKYHPPRDLPGLASFFGEGAEIFVDAAGHSAVNFPYNTPLADNAVLIVSISRAAEPLEALGAKLERTTASPGKTGPGGKYSADPAVGRDEIAEVRMKARGTPYLEIEYKLPGFLPDLNAAQIAPVIGSVSTAYTMILGNHAKPAADVR